MNGGGSIIILVALFAVLWLVLIRPQKSRQQRQQQLLNSVEPGDEILTVGGLYGIVQSVDEENDLIVEVAEGIHVRIARRAIATVVKPDEEEREDEHENEDEDEDGEIDEGPRADADGERNGSVAELGGPEGDAADAAEPSGSETVEATQRRLFGRRS